MTLAQIEQKYFSIIRSVINCAFQFLAPHVWFYLLLKKPQFSQATILKVEFHKI